MKKQNAVEIWGKMFETVHRIRERYEQTNHERPCQQITLAQYKVMNCILFNPGGCSVKELSERLCLTPGAVSQIVEKLVREGTMVRARDGNDRRSVRITLSEKGW